MALVPEDINEEYIASSRALAVTGAPLMPAPRAAGPEGALEYARRHGLRTALDIDYRPVLWGLTSLGDGETRFIESGPVTKPASGSAPSVRFSGRYRRGVPYCRRQHRYADGAEKCP